MAGVGAVISSKRHHHPIAAVPAATPPMMTRCNLSAWPGRGGLVSMVIYLWGLLLHHLEGGVVHYLAGTGRGSLKNIDVLGQPLYTTYKEGLYCTLSCRAWQGRPDRHNLLCLPLQHVYRDTVYYLAEPCRVKNNESPDRQRAAHTRSHGSLFCRV